MTVSEYNRKYDINSDFKMLIIINDIRMNVLDVYRDYPNYELNDGIISILDSYENFSLINELQTKKFDEVSIVSFYRKMLDEYRVRGGHPLDWLYNTLINVHNNPHNYPVELISTIEKSLAGWINHFESLPQYIKDTDLLIFRPEDNNLSESQFFFESLEDAIIDTSHYEMIIGKLHENGYCTPKGSWKDHKAGWKTAVASLIKWLAVAGYCRKRKFSTNEISAIVKNTFNISDNIESTIKHAPSAPAAFKSLFPEVEE